MARLGRYFVSGQVLHVIQRGNNRQPIFFCDDDYALYRDWLALAARRYRVAVHAFVLMTNHVHLLVTPQALGSVSGMMQSLGRRYVRHVNVRYRRTGTLWEGRYRAAPIDSDAYFLACSRYIELNPVRARIVTDPAAYRWSSFHASALGTQDDLVESHPLYLELGPSPAEQQVSYRALFAQVLSDTFLDGLRAATNGWAFGNDRFQHDVSGMAGRRSKPLPPGRKAKVKDEDSQESLL